MIIDTLSKYPEIGITSTVGTSVVHWLGIINPVLSTLSLMVGISVVVVTLYLQIQKVRKS